MSVLTKIQTNLGKYTLKKRQKTTTRTIKATGFEKAKEIGIVYDATNRNDCETVKHFVNYLIEERKKVLALGFINSKDSSEIVKAHLNYQYFDKRNLNKMLIPQGKEIENFIASPFTILIDLNSTSCFPIEYIATLSKARFKVGSTGDYRDAACDLTINLTEKKSLDYFIIQLKHYLKMIHN